MYESLLWDKLFKWQPILLKMYSYVKWTKMDFVERKYCMW